MSGKTKMKRRLQAKELLKQTSDNFRKIFHRVTERELEEVKRDKRMVREDDDTDFTRGGSSNQNKKDGGGGGVKNTNSIPAGRRTDRWFEKVEETADENETRSLQNRKLLERLDYRTVWIARIIVGILVALLGRLLIPAVM